MRAENESKRYVEHIRLSSCKSTLMCWRKKRCVLHMLMWGITLNMSFNFRIRKKNREKLFRNVPARPHPACSPCPSPLYPLFASFFVLICLKFNFFSIRNLEIITVEIVCWVCLSMFWEEFSILRTFTSESRTYNLTIS